MTKQTETCELDCPFNLPEGHLITDHPVMKQTETAVEPPEQSLPERISLEPQRYGPPLIWLDDQQFSSSAPAAAERLYDDTDPVMAALSVIADDGYATDNQRGAARIAMKEILRLRRTPSFQALAEEIVYSHEFMNVPTVEAIISKHTAGDVEAKPTVCRNCGYDDSKWVTIGRIKVDIENETETFERIYPAGEPKPVVCRLCGHNNVSDGAKGTSIYGMCIEPVKDSSFTGWPKPTHACGCKCDFGEPKPDQKGETK